MLRFPDASHWITATHFFLFERICSVFCAIWQSRTPFSQQVNGHAPFFRANFSVFGDIERICSVFYAVFEPFSSSKVGGLNRSEWVDMLRFRQYRMCIVDDNEDVVFSCNIEEQCNAIAIPSYIQGTFELQFIWGNICYYCDIELN